MIQLDFRKKLMKGLLLFTAGLVSHFGYGQSFRTVTFSGSTTDFNASEKYSSVDNVDYYVTYDATYIYIGAFRTNNNTWGQFDHFTMYFDADPKSGVTAGGNGTTTGVNWDGNTPTLPFQADYRIAIRRNNSGESFYSSYGGSSWTTGAANAKGYTQYATSSANGALEIRVPWSDLGSPNGIYFIMYASYNTGYFGSAPNGTSASGPASGKYFGGIGVSSQGCTPTSTTNTPITDLLNNAAPASGAKYGKVTISSGSFSAGGSFTVAPGGSIVMTGGTLTLGSNTVTMGAGSTINNSGATFTTAGSALSCSGDITFSGSSNIALNNFSLTSGSTVNVATNVSSSQNFSMGSGATNNFNFINNSTFTTSGISTLGSNTLNLLNGGNSGSSKFITSSTLSIGTGTSFSLGTSSLPLQVNSDVTLTGTGNLTLGSNVGGDIYLQGNWTRGTGTFTPNGRAVTFNGTTTQTIAATTPPNTFDYLAVNNTGGSVKFSNAVSLNNNLQLFIGILDLNQQTLTLSNTSNIELGDGTASSTTESIISTGGTGTITIPTTKTITVTKRSGVGTPTFSIGNNVLVDVIGTFNPGSSLSTFASGSTLRLSAGTVSTNSPSYASGSSLTYNGFGSASGNSPSTLSFEWPSTNSPTNVTLQSGSNSFVSLTGNRTIAGNFVIGSGCKFNANNSGATDALITMSGGSSGTPLTLQNDGTMFGEYGGKTLSLTVNSGSFVQLAGTTGYVDFKNTTIDGTLTCGNIGINTNSAAPANGNVTVSSTGTLQTTNTFGLYDGSTNNTTIRRSSGNMNAPTINSVSTVVYNNTSGGQTVSAISYGNLTMSNTSGTQTASGIFSVAGNLTLNVSSIFADGGNTITVSGNVAGSGSHIGAGKILMNGSAKTISGVTLNNLQLNNAGGYSLNGSPTINGLLTLTSGNLDVNGQTLTLAGTVSATSSITASGISSTVVISGPSSIPSGLFTTNTISNLTINRIGGVSMGSDLTITDVYTALSGKFSIAGNTLTLNGAITCDATNSLSSTSASNIVLSGTAKTLFFDGSNNTLRNLTISGSNTMTLGNALNIIGGSSFGVVTIGSGATLATGGNLTLKSDVNGTGAIGNSSGTISGNVTVEKFISASGRRWRYLGAPVTGQTLASWGSQFYITGPGTAGATVGSANSNGYATTRSNLLGFNLSSIASVKRYDETVTGSLENGWSNPSSHMSTNLTPGVGYRAFVRGPITGTYATDTIVIGYFDVNGSPPTQSSFTLTQIGGITNGTNAGSVALPISATATGAGNSFDASNDGWNLLANPYPCAYDWAAFWASNANRTNISTAIHVFDATSNSYKSYNAQAASGSLSSGLIPSATGFFVQATGTGASLTFTEAFKTTTNPLALHKTSANNELHIKYFKDSTESDEYILKMIDGATLNKDDYDITKMKNDNLNLSSYGSDSVYLTLSSIPVVTTETRVSMNVEATQKGTYFFNFNNLESFSPAMRIQLLDKFTQKTIDVRKTGSYTFVMDSLPHQWGKDRFVLILNDTTFASPTAVKDIANEISSSFALYPVPTNDVLNIAYKNNTAKNIHADVFDTKGNRVTGVVLNALGTDGKSSINVSNLAQGIYFIQLSDDNGAAIKTMKFVK